MDAGLDLIALCLPGLEPWLLQELRALEIAAEPEATPGGVAFPGGFRELCRANLECGLATQVLVTVATFGARSLQDLDHRGARIDWRQWLRPGARCAVKARCRRSRIYHSGAAEERIARHLVEQLGDPDPDAPEVTVRVRIDDNRCRVALDTSGEPLHRRGWRLETAKAPVREDLARALLLASGWDRRAPLLDPMAGSGTILIEAATLAAGMAPGRLRGFAFEQLAGHDPGVWAALREAAEARREPAAVRLFGSDRDAGAVEAARRNAARAGVDDAQLHLRQASLSDCLAGIEPGATGALVTNPPYGRRTGEHETLANLYQSIGHVARQLPAGWRVALLVADRRLALRTGLPLSTAWLADSGGQKVRAMVGQRGEG